MFWEMHVTGLWNVDPLWETIAMYFMIFTSYLVLCRILAWFFILFIEVAKSTTYCNVEPAYLETLWQPYMFMCNLKLFLLKCNLFFNYYLFKHNKAPNIKLICLHFLYRFLTTWELMLSGRHLKVTMHVFLLMDRLVLASRTAWWDKM